MKCTKCGSNTLKLVGEHLHVQTFRCGQCGEAVSSLFFPAEEVREPVDFEVWLIWHDTQPTVQDALAVRDLDSAAAKTGVKALLEELQGKRVWSLGVHSDYQANALKKRAQEFGLKVELRQAKNS